MNDITLAHNEESQRQGMVHNLARQILDVLNSHYPGYVWLVKVDDVGGVASVFNLHLSATYGYILHLDNIQQSSRMLKLASLRAGGELLERHNLNRGRKNDTQIAEIRRDIKGNAVNE
jgi:hypothetical protein